MLPDAACQGQEEPGLDELVPKDGRAEGPDEVPELVALDLLCEHRAAGHATMGSQARGGGAEGGGQGLRGRHCRTEAIFDRRGACERGAYTKSRAGTLGKLWGNFSGIAMEGERRGGGGGGGGGRR